MILQAAIALLDEGGEGALTFRALAARLGGGVGSVYWYVASREELLARAADEVMGQVLVATDGLGAHRPPIATLRSLGLALFGAMADHPWLAAYLLRDVELQPNSIRLYERFGQQVLRLELTPRQRFHAVSALLNYIVGVGADMAQSPVDDPTAGTPPSLADAAALWRALPVEEFPFAHEVVEEFASHRNEDQFTAGLDLMLAGLAQQAGLG